MDNAFLAQLQQRLDTLTDDGFFKTERVIDSAQSPLIRLAGGEQVLNFCANNYLGLANDVRLIEAAAQGLERHGFGMASVRFICGTQQPHKQLESALSAFLGTEDSILYSSCFDANGGLFETLLDAGDAVISDELNHASIIDGVRLCKAQRYRYRNNDMADLEVQLQAADAAGARFKLIATDGVFSMDGVIADLRGICDLAERYNAQVMVDDSHAVGFVGAGGRGTVEHCGVQGRVDIITGTLGKALGGASGGFTSGRRQIVALLRQLSRPYLFSNSLAPCIVSASLRVLQLIESAEGGALRLRLQRNTARFRKGLQAAGFQLTGAGHPIVPVMLGDASLAAGMAEALLREGVYVIGFSFPVVPKGRARIRTQMSAAHTDTQIDASIGAFTRVGHELGVLT